MTQKRITVEEVLAARDKTGVAVGRGIVFLKYTSARHRKPCAACALSVLYLSRARRRRRITVTDVCAWAWNRYGNYAHEFMSGFDNASFSRGSRGYADGRAVAAAVFGEGE